MPKNLQGRWSSVLRDFVGVVLIVCAVRWAVAEPFLVPSGSMIPTLLIKDYILVSKYSYGLRIPFTKIWLWGPQTPQRGDIVVFRSKDDNYYFMVKRVVGLPGDKVIVDGVEHKLSINGEPIEQAKTEQVDEDFEYFNEQLGRVNHQVQYGKDEHWNEDRQREFIVPEGHIFLMGDNRDRSSDSRVWGALPMTNLLGQAQFIWMSCHEDSPAASVFCFGEDMRQDRLFKKIK